MRAVADLTRIQYWNGQRLRAGDFRLQNAVTDELRWWHNRAFHSALGIAEGLRVTWLPNEAAPVSVQVQAGVAYDGYGRELLLTRTTELALPQLPPNGRALLVLRYRRSGTAALNWVETGHVARCEGVALAAVAPDAAAVVKPARTLVAEVRALSRPRLATGETPRTNTPWEPWKVPFFDGFGIEETAFGVQTRVDTATSGFTVTPHYFATPIWDSANRTFAPALFGHVAEASATGFTYRLLLRGIGRQVLTVAHGIAAVAEIGETVRAVTLDDAKAFLAGDRVVRVNPSLGKFSSVESIEDEVLVLSAPLEDLDEPTRVAHAWLPRTAVVAGVRERLMRVVLANDAGFPAGSLILALSDGGQPIAPATVDEVTGSAVVLRQTIAGLKRGDQLAGLKQAAKIASVAGKRVVIDTPGAFAPGDVLVAVTDRPEPSHAGVVDQVQTDGVTIDLKAAFPVVANGTPAAKPQPGIEVKSVRQFSTTVTLEDDSPFREGDVVCRPAAAIPTAAVVDSGKDKRIVLSQPLDGLVRGDTIASAAFPVRTTVTSAGAGAGPSIQVGSTAAMARDDLLFVIGEDDSLQLVGAIERVAGTTVELRGTAVPLQAGDVVGVARASASGEVRSVSADRLEIEIEKLGEFRVGDPVSIQGAQDGTVSVVDEVTPQGIRLDRPLEGLKQGDRVGLLHVSGAFIATPKADASKYGVERPQDFRRGDLVGPVSGWRAASAEQTIARIDQETLHLSGGLDGLSSRDGVGPADFTTANASLRLEKVDGLALTDQVALASDDTVTGAFGIVLGVINNIDPAARRIALAVFGNPRLRPEAMTAATLYHSRFTDTFSAFARKEGLYVAWLGCQGENRDPSACPEEPQLPTTECGEEEQR